ncbi:putative protein kinase RLK-Pelle-RLCK-Os family [Helianthus annuus]|nr:putative protein kinase RLK-Pelle-RLCK-Os family [Helianthus annuus]
MASQIFSPPSTDDYNAFNNTPPSFNNTPPEFNVPPEFDATPPSSFNNTPPDDSFSTGIHNITRTASSSDDLSNITLICATVVVSIAIIAVAIWCFIKKRRTTIPATTANVPLQEVTLIADQQSNVTSPLFQQVQIQEETMEIFLDDLQRAKPVRFSCQDINVFTNNLSSFLGSGGYGDVYKGTIRKYGVTIAVKVLKDKKAIKQQFKAEVGILGKTHHANLVRLYGYCFDPTMIALVYEYMERGSLDKLIFDKEELIMWEDRRRITIGIAKGLAYLHEDCQQRIVHYDIKPGNVLLDSKLNPKVADFGLAKLCNTASMEDCSHLRGTTSYTAPEFHKPFMRVTYKCDVYSFGMVLFEITMRRRNCNLDESDEDKGWLPRWAWNLYRDHKLSDMFLESGIEKENYQEAENMLMVAFLCVQDEPDERPSMSNVVKMLEGEKEINSPLCPFTDAKSSVGTNNLAIKIKEENSNATSTRRAPEIQSRPSRRISKKF